MIFDEKEHKYFLDGKELPSVSVICNLILGQTYEGVPEFVLKKAAEFGTKVHSAIELYCTTDLIPWDLTIMQEHCFNEFLRLSVGYKGIENEFMGHYEDKFAGTIDWVVEKDGITIIDFKTTSEYHKERVRLQLSLYRLIWGWDKVTRLMCMWLPKGGQGQLYEVESWDKEELLKEVDKCIKELRQQESLKE